MQRSSGSDHLNFSKDGVYFFSNLSSGLAHYSRLPVRQLKVLVQYHQGCPATFIPATIAKDFGGKIRTMGR